MNFSTEYFYLNNFIKPIYNNKAVPATPEIAPNIK